MPDDDITSRMPGEWFEDQGVPLVDTMLAVFLHDGKASLGLFVRDAKSQVPFGVKTAPMAVSRTGEIFLVIGGEVQGWLRPVVHLMLKGKDGSETSLKVPYGCLAKGCEKQLDHFLEFTRDCSGILKRVPLANYMFAGNIQLKD